MKFSIRAALAAAVFAGAGLCASEPARADNWSIRISGGGIGFSYDSGGYCDAWGCPDDFWDYPIYYCPVYYRGHWYSGPVYYRRYHGLTWFWIRGGWHREDPFGARPGWACRDRFGPALDIFFYESRGFRIRDYWRQRWERDHGWDWNRGRNEWRNRHNDWNNHKGRDRDRDSDWQKNGGWTRDRQDWNRFDDNDRKHGRNSDDTFRQLLQRDQGDNNDKGKDKNKGRDDRDDKGGRNDQGWNNPFSPDGDQKNNDGNKQGGSGDKPKHDNKAQNDQSGFNPFAPGDTGGNRSGNGDKPRHDKSQNDQGSSNPFGPDDGGRKDNSDKPKRDKSQNDEGNNGGQNNFDGQNNTAPPATTTNPWNAPTQQNSDDGSKRHRGEPQ